MSSYTRHHVRSVKRFLPMHVAVMVLLILLTGSVKTDAGPLLYSSRHFQERSYSQPADKTGQKEKTRNQTVLAPSNYNRIDAIPDTVNDNHASFQVIPALRQPAGRSIPCDSTPFRNCSVGQALEGRIEGIIIALIPRLVSNPYIIIPLVLALPYIEDMILDIGDWLMTKAMSLGVPIPTGVADAGTEAF